MPQRFLDNFESYKAGDAIVFEGISFFEVGIMIFTGQLHKLASYVVQIQDKKRSQAEIVAMFEHRFKPIPMSATNASARDIPPIEPDSDIGSDKED